MQAQSGSRENAVMYVSVSTLRECALMDAGVLAAGLERGWASENDAVAYAVEKLVAGDDRPEALELVIGDDLDLGKAVHLLRSWARNDRLRSQNPDEARRCWMFAALVDISTSSMSPDEKLDRLEDVYAELGYPYEMRECSRYFAPFESGGEVCAELWTSLPLAAMEQLILRLRREFTASELHVVREE